MRDKVTNRISVDQLAKLFGLPSDEDIAESDDGNEAYSAALKDAEKEGLSPEECEARAMAAEQEVTDEYYRQWRNAVMSVAERLFEDHGLELSPLKSSTYEFLILPTKGWRHAASKILDTINGVGMFEFSSVKEFLDSGPYTARQAVLSHLHWIKDRPRVYGTTSPRGLYDAAVR